MHRIVAPAAVSGRESPANPADCRIEGVDIAVVGAHVDGAVVALCYGKWRPARLERPPDGAVCCIERVHYSISGPGIQHVTAPNRQRNYTNNPYPELRFQCAVGSK